MGRRKNSRANEQKRSHGELTAVKVVLTTGHPHGAFTLVHEILCDAGLAKALPSSRGKLTPEELQAKLAKTTGRAANEFKPFEPGRVWQELAVDLFVANMDVPAWGWSDSATVRLLDFWRKFDPSTRFVLVYCPPEFAVGKFFLGREMTKDALDEVTADWSAYGKAILRFYKKYKGRCELVNVVGAVASPVQLLEQLCERWTLPLRLPVEYADHRRSIDTVAASLARSALRNCTEVFALYLELEAAATFGGAAASATEEQTAWNEFAAERRALANTDARANQLEQQLTKEARTTLNLKAKLEQCKEQIAQLTIDRDAHCNLATERATELSAVKKQLVAQSKVTTPANSAVRLAELQKENALLLLQLQQLQEELDHHYLKNQELLTTVRGDTFLLRFVKDNQPSDVVLDLRGDINGENWYHAEEDGRWAGPLNNSLLRIPALLPGRYTLEVEIVDAMTPAIVEEMVVLINGVRVPTEPVLAEAYPLVVSGRFDTSAMATDDTFWNIELRFQRTISPTERGESDDRFLAIRVRSISLALQ